MKRRYLITGAQGLIGRYLTARILEAEEDSAVLGVGRSTRIDGFFTHAFPVSGEQRRAPMPADLLASFDERYWYRSLSLLETGSLQDLIQDFQPDCIFHLATALSSASERDLLETNVEGTASLMNAMCDSQAKTLLVVGSSGSVYGEASSLPISESHPCRPADLYGVTKLTAEHVARVKAARANVPFVIARIFNVVGPGQAESHVCGRFAAQLAAIAGSRRTLDVGPLGATRDFIDARDVAAALFLLARRGERSGTYNVATGRETAIHFILSELIRISALETQVEIVRQSDRPTGVTRQVADVSRLQRLGFVPRFSIEDSLRDLLRYHQELRQPASSSTSSGSDSSGGLEGSKRRSVQVPRFA